MGLKFDTNRLVCSENKDTDQLCSYCTAGSWPLFLARLFESTGRAIAVTPASALASALLKMLKFLVKVFMSLYLMKV